MTFLNPLALVALAAAAIPLLLHLLNLRKLRTVEFSSLRFLKELQKTRIRRLKLKQLLLLLLRIALVVFAVLAFARPALKGSAGLPGSHASTTAIILLDNSFSMSLRDERGTRFNQAKRAALDVVDLLEDNDEAYLVPMTDLKSGKDMEPTHNREVLRKLTSDMPLNYRRADLDDAIRVAASLLDRSENINKEVYIITDAQRTNTVGKIDSLRVFDASTRVYVLPIGARSNITQTNIALDSIRVVSAIFERDKPLEVRAWVHNYGEREVRDASVSLFVAGERLAQASASVDAGKSEVIDLSAPPKRSGLISGYVELEGDDFDSDNRRYFALPILDRIRTALVGTPENTNFLNLAIGLSGQAVSADRIAPSGLSAVDLSKYSAVILADVPTVTQGDASRLSDYVQSGGGVVIYSGPSVDRAGYNQTIGTALGFGLGAPMREPGATGEPIRFGSVEKEHPIFSGVFDPANPGNIVESPSITQALPASGGETIIRLSNGLPFMSEYRRGRGRVIYIAAPPTMAWSDFPTKGIFVPIAIRTALYVSATGDPFPETTVGESITVPLPVRGPVPDQVKVVSPDGRDEFVPVRKYPSGAAVAYDATTEPGVYHINVGGEDVALFSANMGSGESDLKPMSEKDLKEVVGAAMVAPGNLTVLAPSSGEFGEAITQSRFGLELWKYMLVLALVCAFAEMFVGRAPKEGAAA